MSRLGGARSGGIGVFSFMLSFIEWSSIVGEVRLGGAGVCLLLLRLGVTGAHCSSSLSLGGIAGSAHRSLPWSLSSLGGARAAAAHLTPSLSSLSSVSLGGGAAAAHRTPSLSTLSSVSLGGGAGSAQSSTGCDASVAVCCLSWFGVLPSCWGAFSSFTSLTISSQSMYWDVFGGVVVAAAAGEEW